MRLKVHLVVQGATKGALSVIQKEIQGIKLGEIKKKW